MFGTCAKVLVEPLYATHLKTTKAKQNDPKPMNVEEWNGLVVGI